MSILIYSLGVIASGMAGVMLFDREDKLNRRTMLFTILISFFFLARIHSISIR